MKKVDKKALLMTGIVCLLPMLVGFILYPRLPEQMASHWNFSGEADGYSSKAFAVFGLPAMMLAFHLLLFFAMSADPKRGNMSEKLVRICLWICPVISVLCCGMTMLYSLGCNIDVEKTVSVLIGVLLVVLGNNLPKTRQSYTMGIKLPWTLNSEENWNRTHRLGGFLFVAVGLLFIVLSLVGCLSLVWLIGAVLALILVPTVYSYLLYRKGI